MQSTLTHVRMYTHLQREEVVEKRTWSLHFRTSTRYHKVGRTDRAPVLGWAGLDGRVRLTDLGLAVPIVLTDESESPEKPSGGFYRRHMVRIYLTPP